MIDLVSMRSIWTHTDASPAVAVIYIIIVLDDLYKMKLTTRCWEIFIKRSSITSILLAYIANANTQAEPEGSRR